MTRLAELLSEIGDTITPQGVADWERVPATRCLDVERVTGVSKHVLRPDIYGKDPKAKGRRPKSTEPLRVA
jgi:DNA-binding transcriptional regulator YdaS (Cro superfamily)